MRLNVYQFGYPTPDPYPKLHINQLIYMSPKEAAAVDRPHGAGHDCLILPSLTARYAEAVYQPVDVKKRLDHLPHDYCLLYKDFDQVTEYLNYKRIVERKNLMHEARFQNIQDRFKQHIGGRGLSQARFELMQAVCPGFFALCDRYVASAGARTSMVRIADAWRHKE